VLVPSDKIVISPIIRGLAKVGQAISLTNSGHGHEKAGELASFLNNLGLKCIREREWQRYVMRQ
jgi:hypothetical protein